MDFLTDNEIIKALKQHLNRSDSCDGCPVAFNRFTQPDVSCVRKLLELSLDLITSMKAEKDALIAGQETLQKYIAEQKVQLAVLKHELPDRKYGCCVRVKNGLIYTTTLDEYDQLIGDISSEAVKELVEKIDKYLKRYSHLHKHADKAKHSTEEYADGTPMEMVSVWEVLSLKKWEMVDCETMSTLQDNIETIALERLLTEIEKDFRLFKKEMGCDDNG